jgi:hypothetical protein
MNIGWILVILTWYMAPWLISVMRKHKDCSSIFVLNFFLGWTGLGWIGALVWAFSSNVKE